MVRHFSSETHKFSPSFSYKHLGVFLSFENLLRSTGYTHFTTALFETGETEFSTFRHFVLFKLCTSSFAKKKPVDFDDELKIGDVWYDNMTKITIKVQLFWRLPYET